MVVLQASEVVHIFYDLFPCMYVSTFTHVSSQPRYEANHKWAEGTDSRPNLQRIFSKKLWRGKYDAEKFWHMKYLTL